MGYNGELWSLYNPFLMHVSNNKNTLKNKWQIKVGFKLGEENVQVFGCFCRQNCKVAATLEIIIFEIEAVQKYHGKT